MAEECATEIVIVLPARDEADCIGAVIGELNPWCARLGASIAVGANACRDDTAMIAGRLGAVVGETAAAGYGHGCLAAIGAAREVGLRPGAWIFMAADGANDPAELPRFVSAWRRGADLVLGQRALLTRNWPILGLVRTASNVALALWASVLGGYPYSDLGPYRLISSGLMERLPCNERTWGWTIEPQVLAPRLGARVRQLQVRERPRMAGAQKITGVGWRHSLHVGAAIAAAAWRAHRRMGGKPGGDRG
ncbi:MAG TPA: hypothetical protein PLU30_13200 [Verrucomicrobiae bacterium]|nr:hypothetical protein [Verrucomicrobiae bacterium]